MPDWSYQTLFKPALFRLPAETARDVTLGAMGALSKLPGGSLVIRTLGHMESHPILHTQMCGIPVKYPVGLGGSLDVHGTAHDALAQFGFGYIEIGPVTVRPVNTGAAVRRDAGRETILYPSAWANDGLEAWIGRLERRRKHKLPYMARIRPMPDCGAADAPEELRLLASRLSPYAAAFFVDVLDAYEEDEALELLDRLSGTLPVAAGHKPLLLYVPLGISRPLLEKALDMLERSRGVWKGAVIGDAQKIGGGAEAAAGMAGLAGGGAQGPATASRSQAVGETAACTAGAAGGAVGAMMGSGRASGGPAGRYNAGQTAAVTVGACAAGEAVAVGAGGLAAGLELTRFIRGRWRSRTDRAADAGGRSGHWGAASGGGTGCGHGDAAVGGDAGYGHGYASTVGEAGYGHGGASKVGDAGHGREDSAAKSGSFGSRREREAPRLYANSGYEPGDAAAMSGGDRGKVPKAAAAEGRNSSEPAPVIIMSAGIHEPQHALDALDAGADYVQLHSGLVYAGPGLPKRINEAVVYRKVRGTAAPEQPFWRNWGWMCLLGLGMIIGGALAWLIAATVVVLPYDVSFLGMTSQLLSRANARILPFMSHDRITLAGTMISIGVIYFMLARYGLRYGLHWCKTALMTSCAVGFSSFFLYLGYGYFDPLHALVAAILLPMFILSMRGHTDEPSRRPPNVHNDRDWRLAQWGQLMMVVVGFGLALGGAVISFIGITDVFVPTDLAFLCATPEMLKELNERIIPLIAHDRAGFGGALFSDAIAISAAALWGVQKGERWLWWMFLLGGLPGFFAGFSVHAIIGYTDFIHLLPAYFAFAVYVLGLVLLYPYMVRGKRAAA
ncbi:hypothetical protein [Paenibacillus hamazuiensis]|uniref:hypothetical protein n=1 Tax=Paenibacillus hamazuiensis TaxID=2936508 RepID=UPI00200EB948|nr:hypothetical protein [Paenibacillus hamazuiensis]